MRMMKAAIAAALGFSMASAPVLAQSAAPLSVAHSVARAGAETEDNSQINGGYIIPGLIIVAIIVGVILLTDGNNNPSSP